MGLTGLTSAEVEERIQKGRVNVATRTTTKKISGIFIENIFSVFNIIIFSIIIFLLIFYFRSGDNRLLLDSIGVSTVAIINTLIAVVQEIRAKRALDKVNLLLRKEVTVIRNGNRQLLDQSSIVIDDLIVLERGDQAAVDGALVAANHLEIDESLLTGESVPVEKKADDTVLSGSFCVSGNGYYIAQKVGDESYAAEVTRLAKKFKLNLSPLEIKLNFIVKMLFFTALLLVLLEVILTSANFGNVDFIRKISTILISLVPQGLVLMSSVTFALGIYRISRIGAIIQRLNAIESFSNVKVVCTDKTGTLTQNKLSVNRLTLLDPAVTESAARELLGTYAKLSSDKNATLRTLEVFPCIDGAGAIDEVPFSSEKKMSLLKFEAQGKERTLILGGYDVLIENAAGRAEADGKFDSLGLKVYRNLLLAEVPPEIHLDDIRKSLKGLKIHPVCIVSISDSVREDVMDAIKLFHNNNIEIKILSGDSADAVQAVAREIGWDIRDDELISGTQIDSTGTDEFPGTVMKKKIFARLKPEHKLRIIKALKKQKVYTAMIGDGVNDLPAIKESDMGIAMEEGSQITKEVADIVLLKNKFSLLPDIFNEGNRIINTVNAVAKLFLTKNFMVIYLTLLSLFFMFGFPLTPRRVSLINIFAIGLPSFVIALRNTNVSPSKNFMKELFSFVALSALIIVGAAYAGQFYGMNIYGATEEDLQMVMMSIMIFTTVSNYLSVALHRGERNYRLYLGYGVLILGLYLFLAVTNIDFTLLVLIKKLYEISFIEPRYWWFVAVISLISSGVLFTLQKLRQRVIKQL